MAWISGPNFPILQDEPATVSVWLNLGLGRYLGQLRVGISDYSNAVIQLVIVRDESNVAEVT